MTIDVRKLDFEGGLIIQPRAGFVIKTTSITGKVFINVCHADDLAPVSVESAGIRVPISIGTLSSSVDAKGVPCEVVDVVINSENTVIDRDQLINVLIDSVNAKLSVELKYISLPNLKYKGDTIGVHRIKVKRDSWIQEQNSETNDTHNFTLMYILHDGSAVDVVDERTPVPNYVKSCQLTVPCSGFKQVHVSKERWEISLLDDSVFSVWFPTPMDPESCRASFSNGVLQANISLLNSLYVINFVITVFKHYRAVHTLH